MTFHTKHLFYALSHIFHIALYMYNTSYKGYPCILGPFSFRNITHDIIGNVEQYGANNTTH